MKALILSCSTGGGHNAAAHALCEELQARQHEADYLDVMTLGPELTENLVDNTYIKTVQKLPWVFGEVYKLGAAVSDFNGTKYKSPVYYACSLLSEKLLTYIEDGDYDIVICSHLYPAEMMTHLRRQKKTDLPVVAIATDYALIPFWQETDCDIYTIPHRDCALDYAFHGIPMEKLYPTGIPVSRRFQDVAKRSVESVREELGIGAAGTVSLVAGGSMGSGDLYEIARHFSRELKNDEYAVFVCGTNQKLRKKLEHHFGHHPRMRILGYTDRMAEYMRASDIIFTKPGGLTTTEAANLKIPIVHCQPIPGVEPLDRAFFMAHSMSITGKNVREQVERGEQLMRDPKSRELMQDAMELHINPYAATDIAVLCEQLSAIRDRNKAILLATLYRPVRERGEGILCPPI